MRSISRTLLLTLLLSLVACGRPVPPVPTWVKPIYFSDETLIWIKQHNPPQHVLDDLWKVVLHNRKVEAILPAPQGTPAP